MYVLCPSKGFTQVDEELAWTAQACLFLAELPRLQPGFATKNHFERLKHSHGDPIQFVAIPAGSGRVVEKNHEGHLLPSYR